MRVDGQCIFVCVMIFCYWVYVNLFVLMVYVYFVDGVCVDRCWLYWLVELKQLLLICYCYWLVLWNLVENRKRAKLRRNVLGLRTILRPKRLFLYTHLICYTVTVIDKNHVFFFRV